MHPRLRRLLGAKAATDPAFLDSVDAAFRELDADRALLEGSLQTLTALLMRAQQAEAARAGHTAARRAQAAKAQERLARTIAKSRLATLDLDSALIVRSGNAAAAQLCGLAIEAMPGRHVFELLEPLLKDSLAARWLERLRRREAVAETQACSAADGRALACDWVCMPRASRSGKLLGVTALIRDETARIEAGEREERAALALAGTGDAIWDWDLRTNRLFLGAGWRELLGLDGAGTGRPADWLERVHPDDLAPLRAALTAHFEGRITALEHEHRVRHAGGEWRWISVRGAAIRDGNGAAVRALGLLGDVTSHRLLVERMAHDARHDALTGLPNRTLFLDLLRHSFTRLRRHEDYRFAVLFIDIDRFKAVNDAFGHEAGDKLLVQIAHRLESCLREGDTLARHAGDEFTMRLDDVRSASDAIHVADRVHEVMQQPFDLGGTAVTSSASIGVAIGSSRSIRAEDVLRDADVAMYRAKAAGRARTNVFAQELGESAPTYLQLESDLRLAIGREELRIHYMPIVDMATGRVKGLEALARWQHPRLGLVAPERFLGLAVETGLIVSIDRWMLQMASRQLQEWRRDLGAAAGLTLSVNLSQNALEEHDLASVIDRVLLDAQLVPGDLNLDVGDLVPAGMLTQLHGRGFGLHMDDFGTGQSWLRHLHGQELDSVKIDRSFVTASAGADRAVLRRIVGIARDLGKKVIAEGVETAEQLHCVREAGCNAAQGYFFSAPLDVVRTRSLLKRGGLEQV
jgi:diguanylate cyclase (GGDEF)-like protein/PAS domain S-box-containing protein